MTTLEQARLTAQVQLDRSKSQGERNQLGQFATPTGLASQILQTARQIFPKNQKIRFLDPALGTGAFYSALLSEFQPKQIESATGYEIDLHHAGTAIRLWDGTSLKVIPSDFTKARPPKEKANLLVCNPPYVRHHHLSGEEKLRLKAEAKRVSGVNLSGLSGLYCYFLALSHEWLSNDGLAVWLIPSEFMSVNYGREIRRYLLEKVTLLGIHRFDPNEVQFEDALVSSAVVWFRKTPPKENHSVEFTFGGSLRKPKLSANIPVSSLLESDKWTRFPGTELQPKATNSKLSDFLKISRGLATGDNGFFILNPAQIKEHRIPKQFLIPILPSPKSLNSDEVKADNHGFPSLDAPLFLLSCDIPENEVRTCHPTLYAYLQKGVEAGVNQRFLCSHRSPWYAQEKRLPAPILCSYFGREGTKRGRVFRFVLNHSAAIAANSWLMLYPKGELARAIEDRPELTSQLARILNEIECATLQDVGRVYGGGLHKMEPKELANAPADGILKLLL